MKSFFRGIFKRYDAVVRRDANKTGEIELLVTSDPRRSQWSCIQFDNVRQMKVAIAEMLAFIERERMVKE